MKPLMLIPPAQAEALYDAQQEAPVSDRFAPTPWLDDDAFEDEARSRTPAANGDSSERRSGLRRRAA